MISGIGIQVILKIGVLALLARMLSPVEFGLVGLAIVVVEFSKMLTHMGVGPAIVQRKDLEECHLTTGFTLSLLLGLGFAGILVLLAPLLADFFNMEGLAPVLRAISMIFLIDSLTLIGQALMQRNMKFRTIAAVELVSYAIGYGAVGVVLSYLGWGVWALVSAHLSQAVLQAVLVVCVQPFPKRPGFKLKAFKELIYFGGGFTLGRIANYLALQGDNLVIGRMLGAAALGIYGRAYQFMVMPATLFGNSLDRALFPAMAKVQEDKKKLGNAFLTGVGFIALLGIPLSVILFFLAPEIVMVLLGSKWTEVIVPFQILAFGMLFRMSYKISDTLVRATGAVYKRAWRQLIYATMVVLGSYIGQFWGLYGVACGVVFALITNFLMMAHLSIKLTGINWLNMVKAHGHGILIGLTSGITTYFLLTFCRQHLESSLLILIITSLGIGVQLVITTWCFPAIFIGEDQKALLNRLLKGRLKRTPASQKAVLTHS